MFYFNPFTSKRMHFLNDNLQNPLDCKIFLWMKWQSFYYTASKRVSHFYFLLIHESYLSSVFFRNSSGLISYRVDRSLAFHQQNYLYSVHLNLSCIDVSISIESLVSSFLHWFSIKKFKLKLIFEEYLVLFYSAFLQIVHLFVDY